MSNIVAFPLFQTVHYESHNLIEQSASKQPGAPSWARLTLCSPFPPPNPHQKVPDPTASFITRQATAWQPGKWCEIIFYQLSWPGGLGPVGGCARDPVVLLWNIASCGGAVVLWCGVGTVLSSVTRHCLPPVSVSPSPSRQPIFTDKSIQF